MRKQDQACLWARHCEQEMSSVIVALRPGERVTLLINGIRTVWARMNDGKDQRPTFGIKIVDGKFVWQMIALGENFDVELILSRDSVSKPDATTAMPKDNRPPVLLQMPTNAGSPLFQSYFFSDYSGSIDPKGQKKSIKTAQADGGEECQLVSGPLTRDSLVVRTVDYLRLATNEGRRVCLGNDHQFGLPYGLLAEIGMAGMSWRLILDAIIDGHGVPPLEHASIYCRKFNDWCKSQGRRPYFYSATKAISYGIPRCDPRAGETNTVLRLTERCDGILGRGNPKPFNRVADNGTVGGQTIMGLMKLRELLEVCASKGIPLKCWPFDGLDISDEIYEGCHVLLEPYLAAVRTPGVPYTDVNDAMACVQFIQRFDQAGKLTDLLDLSCLSDADKAIVQVEGWIAGRTSLSLIG